jgi:hypothetical protein
MRFYNQQHQFYCGVDLHAKTLHLCVLDQAGEILRHRGIRARPQDFGQSGSDSGFGIQPQRLFNRGHLPRHISVRFGGTFPVGDQVRCAIRMR